MRIPAILTNSVAAIAVQPGSRATSGQRLARLVQAAQAKHPSLLVCLRPDACGDEFGDPQHVADSLSASRAWWRRNRDIVGHLPHLSLRTSVMQRDYDGYKRSVATSTAVQRLPQLTYQLAALGHMIRRGTLPPGTVVLHPSTRCDADIAAALAVVGATYAPCCE